MDRQPMARVTHRMRQTEPVRSCVGAPYTLAHRGAPRLPCSVRGLPRRKCIPGVIVPTSSKYPLHKYWKVQR
ncbi:unnamed protein product [Acanthoscelides obtectus]|uniref:Uncharacterized protein n=1 Tax=Acanthoscelides obtectus TaxID=200917 RepID=A0A9P0Q231_ACAOB|nr:unnamed protein product [Acanthoscelides obtectus]CAK1671807.1 hypothetical protein AOBTE_LOCUS28473 [Acanthoscelides obtectus]